MTRILILIMLLTTFSCGQHSDQQEQSKPITYSTEATRNELSDVKPDCPDDWIVTGKQLKQQHINDSTEQMFLNDTLWFEVIGVIKLSKYSNSSYLKLYRTNGLLQEEGNAIYSEHPIADYTKDGEWKFYDCNGELLETKVFDRGDSVNAN